jgi:hypothetical protein
MTKYFINFYSIVVSDKRGSNMPTQKRSRRGKKPVSTVIKQEDDSKNSQGRTSGLDQLIAWLEDFDMQCNLIPLIDYKETLT